VIEEFRTHYFNFTAEHFHEAVLGPKMAGERKFQRYYTWTIKSSAIAPADEQGEAECTGASGSGVLCQGCWFSRRAGWMPGLPKGCRSILSSPWTLQRARSSQSFSSSRKVWRRAFASLPRRPGRMGYSRPSTPIAAALLLLAQGRRGD